MKRDWDLVRQGLLSLEQTETGQLMPSDVPGWDAQAVSYHMRLLDEAGLIRARCISTNAGLSCVGLSLTWSGHELLDSIRTNTVWNRIKGLVREKGLDLSFEVVKDAARSVLAAMMQ